MNDTRTTTNLYFVKRLHTIHGKTYTSFLRNDTDDLEQAVWGTDLVKTITYDRDRAEHIARTMQAYLGDDRGMIFVAERFGNISGCDGPDPKYNRPNPKFYDSHLCEIGMDVFETLVSNGTNFVGDDSLVALVDWLDKQPFSHVLETSLYDLGQEYLAEIDEIDITDEDLADLTPQQRWELTGQMPDGPDPKDSPGLSLSEQYPDEVLCPEEPSPEDQDVGQRNYEMTHNMTDEIVDLYAHPRDCNCHACDGHDPHDDIPSIGEMQDEIDRSRDHPRFWAPEIGTDEVVAWANTLIEHGLAEIPPAAPEPFYVKPLLVALDDIDSENAPIDPYTPDMYTPPSQMPYMTELLPHLAHLLHPYTPGMYTPPSQMPYMTELLPHLAHLLHGQVCGCDDETCTEEDDILDWLVNGDEGAILSSSINELINEYNAFNAWVYTGQVPDFDLPDETVARIKKVATRVLPPYIKPVIPTPAGQTYPKTILVYWPAVGPLPANGLYLTVFVWDFDPPSLSCRTYRASRSSMDRLIKLFYNPTIKVICAPAPDDTRYFTGMEFRFGLSYA